MTAYVESSVVLRIVLGEANRLADWSSIERMVTSVLTEVECLRALDRRSQRGMLSPVRHAERRAAVGQLMERMERIVIRPNVLRRASAPFPTPLGTLDAIHLSTAILWADVYDERPALATHDAELGTAARAMGFAVVGV